MSLTPKLHDGVATRRRRIRFPLKLKQHNSHLPRRTEDVEIETILAGRRRPDITGLDTTGTETDRCLLLFMSLTYFTVKVKHLHKNTEESLINFSK